MKVTFEVEYVHELTNALEIIAKNWKLSEPVNPTPLNYVPISYPKDFHNEEDTNNKNP